MSSESPAAAEAVDALFVLSDLGIGGTGRAAALIANGLAERGHRIGVMLFTDRGALRRLLRPEIQRFDLAGSRTRYVLPKLTQAIAAIRPTSVMSFLPHANVASIVATKLAGTGSRIVVTEHNQPDARLFKMQSKGLVWAYRLSRFVYPFASCVVCCSDGVKEAWLKRQGRADGRYRVIYNPMVQPSVERLSREPSQHPWANDPSVPLIVAAGRFSPEKDHATLLRAFGLLREKRPARLIILGDGDLRRDLERQRDSLGLAADVDMPGYTENPFSLFRSANLVALSSISEGFPFVLVEALACGTPIVTTRCLAPADQALVAGWSGGAVNVGDERHLADALASALDQPSNPDALMAQVAGLSPTAAIDAYEEVLFGAPARLQKVA